MTTGRKFAVQHGRRSLWELRRYLLAGCAASDLGELMADVCIVLEVAPAKELWGGEA